MEFDELCRRLKDDINGKGNQSLFEITEFSQVPWQSNKQPQSVHSPQTSSRISATNFNGKMKNSKINILKTNYTQIG